MSLTNVGPGIAPAPITLVDEMPVGLSPVSASGEGWACDIAGQTVTCVNDSDFAVGESSIVTIVAEVTAQGGELLVNVASAFGLNPDVLSLDLGGAFGSIEGFVLAAPEDLPRTGQNLDWLAWLGLMALLLGGLLLGTGRRRRSRLI